MHSFKLSSKQIEILHEFQKWIVYKLYFNNKNKFTQYCRNSGLGACDTSFFIWPKYFQQLTYNIIYIFVLILVATWSKQSSTMFVLIHIKRIWYWQCGIAGKYHICTKTPHKFIIQLLWWVCFYWKSKLFLCWLPSFDKKVCFFNKNILIKGVV